MKNYSKIVGLKIDEKCVSLSTLKYAVHFWPKKVSAKFD
jgi:hypothetical protein